jgi:four helix bundle protein
MEVAVAVYQLTERFPKEEQYGLTSQMRRSAVSIPSNIAEGKLRASGKEFLRFLRIAYGSGGELETQILIAKQLPKTANLDYQSADAVLEETMRLLNAFISSLERRFPSNT